MATRIKKIMAPTKRRGKKYSSSVEMPIGTPTGAEDTGVGLGINIKEFEIEHFSSENGE